MKLMWTRSSAPLSKVIRWISKEPVSHFVVCFDNKWVIHSNLLGVHLNWLSTFTKHCEIVYTIECDLSLENEEKVYRSLLDNFDERGYDFGAFFYFLFRGLLYKFLKIPMPAQNKWGNKDKFLCTEISQVLPKDVITIDVSNVDIITPYKLYQLLKGI